MVFLDGVGEGMEPAVAAESPRRRMGVAPLGDVPAARETADGDASSEVALWGIGAKTAKKLAAAGITSVYQLAATDTGELARRFGPTMGPWYRALALGAGGTDVSAEKYLPRSRSRETTFQQNITERPELENQLVALAERVAADVAGEGRPAARVAVKVRFAPFFTHTRSVTLSTPTSDAGEITAAALGLLDKFELGRAVRLLGVRAEFEHAR